MATPLFAHLNADELTRAQSILLFANEARLARKPRCGQTKDYSVIRTAAHAIKHPYVQPNSPVAISRLVFDLDYHRFKHRFHELPIRYLAESHAWEDELGVPAPSWAAISRDKNSAHIGYELVTPVGRHEHARRKPQQYLAATESAMSEKLGADEGFTGQLCKNPINIQWQLYLGPQQGRDLHELAEYVELTSKKILAYNREPRGEIGRNLLLFDTVRFWAYDNVDEHRKAGYVRWEETVIATAERINAASYDHLPLLMGRGLLPFSECKSIGKSVARWTWANHGNKTQTQEFSDLQSWRGLRGAVASAKMKRDRREEQIITAIGQLTAQGKIPTMGLVAQAIDCTKQALSAHYQHLFPNTLQ